MEHNHQESPTVSKYDEALNKYNTALDDSKISEEVQALLDKHLAENDNKETIKSLLSFVDLTTLATADSEETVLKLTEKVNRLDDERPDLPHVAAICVFPNMASIVKQSLEADNVKLACVAGGFPTSQTFTEVKTAETALAVMDGADEIDIVMPVGKFIAGDYETMCDEIDEIKAACAGQTLKVILETCELKTASNVKKAAILSMYSGADFIKTSTGKGAAGATPEAAYVMCQAIKEYCRETDRKIGFKAAGGIRTVKDALTYYTIVKEVLGKEWLTPALFRIGASSLANSLITAIDGKETKIF